MRRYNLTKHQGAVGWGTISGYLGSAEGRSFFYAGARREAPTNGSANYPFQHQSSSRPDENTKQAWKQGVSTTCDVTERYSCKVRAPEIASFWCAAPGAHIPIYISVAFSITRPALNWPLTDGASTVSCMNTIVLNRYTTGIARYGNAMCCFGAENLDKLHFQVFQWCIIDIRRRRCICC